MRRDLEQIVREQGDMVLRLALAHTGNRTDAEDVFQEVFIRLVRSLDKIESEDHLRYWLIRVTINRCKSLFSSAYEKYRLKSCRKQRRPQMRNLWIPRQPMPCRRFRRSIEHRSTSSILKTCQSVTLPGSLSAAKEPSRRNFREGVPC